MEILKNVTLYTNESYLKMLYWFFSFPDRKMGLTELAKELKISKATATQIVRSLLKEGFLKKETIGKAWQIFCNKKHYFNWTRKICFNLQMIFDSNIVQEVYKKFPNAKVIILFGSYRKGDDNEESDIDIAVEVLDGNNKYIEDFGVIGKFGYRKGVIVNANVFSRDKINNNLFYNIVNGIVLDGFLEVKK